MGKVQETEEREKKKGIKMGCAHVPAPLKECKLQACMTNMYFKKYTTECAFCF